MTVPAPSPRYVQYAGDGGSGPFTVPFRFFEAEDMVVELTDASGVRTRLDDCLIEGAGDPGGGQVITAQPVAIGQTLTLWSEAAIIQPADYIAADAFPAETHEGALDRLTLIAQDLRRDVDRSLKSPMGETLVPLAPSDERAGMLMAFDETGNPDTSRTYAAFVDDVLRAITPDLVQIVEMAGAEQVQAVGAEGAGRIEAVQATAGAAWAEAQAEVEATGDDQATRLGLESPIVVKIPGWAVEELGLDAGWAYADRAGWTTPNLSQLIDGAAGSITLVVNEDIDLSEADGAFRIYKPFQARYHFVEGSYNAGEGPVSRDAVVIRPTLRTVDPAKVDPLGRRVVMSNGVLPGTTYGNASYSKAQTRVQTKFLDKVPDQIWAVYWAGSVNGAEVGLGHSMTVAASLEVVGHGYARFGGAGHDAVVASNGWVALGPLTPADFSLSEFPADTVAYVRTMVDVSAAGVTWPTTLSGAFGICHVGGSAQIDGTGAFTNMGGITTGVGLGPAAIIGTWAGLELPSVMIEGDSIAGGASDSTDDWVSTGKGGWAIRACRQARGGSQIPFVQASRPGDRAYQSYAAAAFRQQLAAWCTDIWESMGTNDLAVARTGAQTLAAKQGQMVAQAAYGPERFMWVRMLPRPNSSTDVWTAVSGQTVGGAFQTAGQAEVFEASALALIDTANGPDALLDLRAPLVALSGVAWKWPAPGYTADGVHPSATATDAFDYVSNAYADTLERLHNTMTLAAPTGTFDVLVVDDAGYEWRDDVVVAESGGYAFAPRAGQAYASDVLFFPAGLTGGEKAALEADYA
jgi:hypothetical protein